jgi:hypothetical protein
VTIRWREAPLGATCPANHLLRDAREARRLFVRAVSYKRRTTQSLSVPITSIERACCAISRKSHRVAAIASAHSRVPSSSVTGCAKWSRFGGVDNCSHPRRAGGVKGGAATERTRGLPLTPPSTVAASRADAAGAYAAMPISSRGERPRVTADARRARERQGSLPPRRRPRT